jgi:hypothetical protein
MGLDQFAYVVTDVSGDEKEELAYWRKHNRLQGWMENLYREKGGEEVFNCEDVVLTLEDLDKLEKAINDRTLPETAGFFFGNDSYEDYEEWGLKDTDEKFITEARKAINDGQMVVYSSWW